MVPTQTACLSRRILIREWVKQRSASAAALAIATFVAGGCGPYVVPHEARALRALSFSIKVNASSDEAAIFANEIQSVLTAALRSAGCREVDDDPDFTAMVSVEASPPRVSNALRAFTGVSMAFRDVVVNVGLLAPTGRWIDHGAANFSTSTREVKRGPLEDLIASFVENGHLTAHAQRLARAKQERAELAAEQAQQAQAQRLHEASRARRVREAAAQAVLRRHAAHEQTLWTQSAVEECLKPASLSACDGVKAYAAEFPDGVHSSEANAALTAAEPALLRLADSAQWEAASSGRCFEPSRPEDCSGVTAYLAKYANGSHADEGRMLLAESAGKILRKQEQGQRAQRIVEQARGRVIADWRTYFAKCRDSKRANGASVAASMRLVSQAPENTDLDAGSKRTLHDECLAAACPVAACTF